MYRIYGFNRGLSARQVRAPSSRIGRHSSDDTQDRDDFVNQFSRDVNGKAAYV